MSSHDPDVEEVTSELREPEDRVMVEVEEASEEEEELTEEGEGRGLDMNL